MQEQQPVTLKEWSEFEQQAHALFRRMLPRERLKMWALLAEPLIQEAEHKQAAAAMVYLMRAMAKRLEA